MVPATTKTRGQRLLPRAEADATLGSLSLEAVETVLAKLGER